MRVFFAWLHFHVNDASVIVVFLGIFIVSDLDLFIAALHLYGIIGFDDKDHQSRDLEQSSQHHEEELHLFIEQVHMPAKNTLLGSHPENHQQYHGEQRNIESKPEIVQNFLLSWIYFAKENILDTNVEHNEESKTELKNENDSCRISGVSR